MGGMPYCTREMIMRAPDIGASARSHAQIDRLIEASSRFVDALCVRPSGAFLPISATRTFDWPDVAQGTPWRLWLGDQALVSASELSAAGTVIASTDYFLRPDVGPPFTQVEIDLASSATFSAGDTWQRSIAITGVWMLAPLDDRTVGALTAAVASTTATELAVNGPTAAGVGVGSFVKVDSERMLVTGRAWADTTVNAGAAVDADLADTGIDVADGTAFAVGEQILIDTERMLIEDIAGNTLVVARAQAGSAVSSHSVGVDIYASRSLIVERGALGTTAATHADAAAITRHQVPLDVESLTIGSTIVSLLNESSGYASAANRNDPGSGSSRVTQAIGLPSLAGEVFSRYGRKMRTAAV